MDKPVYKNENALLITAALVSVLAWGLLIKATSGLILLIVPCFGLAYLFVQSGLISHLKGQGALVTDTQFPDIQARVRACAEKIGMRKVPQVYVLNGNGLFNAFATHFLSKTYIVLYASVIDALKDHPEGINFYIGHEMGHIDRRHLTWETFLAPALILPLLGAAYSRAREYTCDMYGALCCTKPEAAQQGLAVLAVGAERHKTLDAREYLAQARETSGFWMSFHELVAGYPWLVKRYARVSPGFTREMIPARNVFAYIPALFVPRFTIVSIIVVYVLFISFTVQPMMEQLLSGAKMKHAQNHVEMAAPEEDAAQADRGAAPVQQQQQPPPQQQGMLAPTNAELASISAGAEAGDAESQVQLGSLYAAGNGVPQSFESAAGWWRKSADQGNAMAQFGLCNLYASGQGLKLDWQHAYFWCSVAVRAGEPHAPAMRTQIAKHLSLGDIAGIDKIVQAWKPAPAPP